MFHRTLSNAGKRTASRTARKCSASSIVIVPISSVSQKSSRTAVILSNAVRLRMKSGYISPSRIGTVTTRSRSLTFSASKRAGAWSGSTTYSTPTSLKRSILSRSSLSQPPVTCSPQTIFSSLVVAASIACLSVSISPLSLPSHVKSNPSAPALMAASTLSRSISLISTTSAAACGFVAALLLPTKPIPLPPCVRRTCVNISSNLLIYSLFLLSYHLLSEHTGPGSSLPLPTANHRFHSSPVGWRPLLAYASVL